MGNILQFSAIKEAIADIKAGKFVIVMDDEGRENEGDLVIAAEKAAPDKINFMLKHGRGLICMPVIGKRLDELRLPQMVMPNGYTEHCAFTISVDAAKGATTGVSAFDRAATVKAVLDQRTRPDDLKRPGHMFPLRYQDGGVLIRQGHTEASVDLAMLAGLYPAAVICEILDDDGRVAKYEKLMEFSKIHDIKIISINDLIEYRKNGEQGIMADSGNIVADSDS